MGSFSCYYSHHISTIEGGLVVTDDGELHDDLLSLRAHGWVRDRSDRPEWVRRHAEFDERFLFVMPGYNVRPMELQGAIGSVQLRRLDAMLAARESLARTVSGWLARAAPWLQLIGSERLPPAGTVVERRARVHSWMTLPLRLSDDAPVSTDALKKRLEAAGVETRPIIAGNLARHPAALRMRGRRAEVLANCDQLLLRGFMIGCHPTLAPGALETLDAAIASLSQL